MYVQVLTDSVAGVVGASDGSTTRTVYGVIIALGVIGVILIGVAIWLIKQTRPEPELLAPLERMDDRAWRRLEPAQMRRDLDAIRPEGARPLVREKSVPEVDADFAQHRPPVPNFDDLQAQHASDARRSTSGDPLLRRPDDDREEDHDADVAETADADEIESDEIDADEIEADAAASTDADELDAGEGERDDTAPIAAPAPDVDDVATNDDTGDIDVDDAVWRAPGDDDTV